MHGFGLGTRLEATLDCGLYLGGSLATHFGERERAERDEGEGGYRAARHTMYLGPEIGWELPTRLLVLRPYVGAGAWLMIDRAAVRNRAVNGDVVSPYVSPGLVVAYRARDWHVGIDFRVPVATALPSADVAPTVFGVVGFTIDRSR